VRSSHHESDDLHEHHPDDLADTDELDEDEVEPEADEVEGLERELDDEASPAADDEEESDQASLDELLAQRRAAKRGSDADDEADIMAFRPEPTGSGNERIPVRIAPVRDQQEFVCKRCHLVKPRVQLADAARGLCRDCA
jgi:hypothetical protein